MADEHERQVEEERKRYLEEIRNREVAEMRYIEDREQSALADMERQGIDTGQQYKMGAGSYVLILFALFVDIIEIFATYSGIGIPIAIVLGLAVDTSIFIGIGTSKNARKQWKRFLAGFVGENFPFLAQAIEWMPIRTLALIWMYRGMSTQKPRESEKEKEQTNNEQ